MDKFYVILIEVIIMKQLENFDVYFFDFDGTLLNSEPYHQKAHNFVLNEILGKPINFTAQMFSRYIGKKDDDIFDMYKKDFGVEFDKRAMIAKKVEFSTELLCDKEVKIFDYFFELAKNKGDKKFYILTNQDYGLLTTVLKSKGIIKYFDDIFSLPKMGVSKKYFVENAKNYVDLNSKKVALFEDVNDNLILAKNNNMFAVGIENSMNCGTLKDADFVIDCSKN